MQLQKTHMDKNGRILIPSELRKKYDMSPGQVFILQGDNESIIVRNMDHIINEMNELFFKHNSDNKGSVVEDFLSKKKEEYNLEKNRENGRK